MKAFLIFLVILLGGCTSHPTESVIGKGGRIAGWFSGGSQVLIRNGPESYTVTIGDNSMNASRWNMPQGGEECARISPQGNYLLRVAEEDNDIRLLLYADPKQAPIVVEKSRNFIACPSWLSDEQNFAVVIGHNWEGGELRIYRRDDVTYQMVAKIANYVNIDWSPNGKYVAIGNGSFIGLVDVASGEMTRLDVTQGGADQPTWSPDSQYIAYIQRYKSRTQGTLMVVSADGARVVVLAGLAGEEFEARRPGYFYTQPTWSPHGDYIVAWRIDASAHDFNESFDAENYQIVLVPVPRDLQN